MIYIINYFDKRIIKNNFFLDDVIVKICEFFFLCTCYIII